MEPCLPGDRESFFDCISTVLLDQYRGRMICFEHHTEQSKEELIEVLLCYEMLYVMICYLVMFKLSMDMFV